MEEWMRLSSKAIILFWICIFFPYEYVFGSEKSEREEVLELSEVLITATKGETPVEEIGLQTFLITGEEIEKKNIRNVSEALRQVPGLNVSSLGSPGSTTSVFARGGESDHLLVLMDGVPVNKSGGEFDFSQLSTENIERIEVVLGPQSALYGSEALAGVVQIITKKGKGPLKGMVSSAAGHRLEDNKPIFENRIGLSGEGFTLSYARIDDPGILPINNRLTRNSFSGRVDFSPSENVAMDLVVRLEDKRIEFPTETAGDRFDPLDPDQFLEEDHLTISTGIRQGIIPGLTHQLRLGLTDQDRNSTDPPNPGRTCVFGGFPFSCDGVSTTVFQSGERRFMSDYMGTFEGDPTEEFHVVANLGVEYTLEELVQTLASDFGFGPSFDFTDVSRTNWGYYFQGQMGFWKRLFLAGGIRVEDNSIFGNHLNRKGSIAYLIEPLDLKIRASIGEGIKNPRFSEQFGTSFSVGNPNLKPEESFSWDIGLDQALFSTGSFRITYFRNEMENLIAFVNDPDFGDPDFLNIQKAKTHGVETHFQLDPFDFLRFQGGFTYLISKVTNDGGIIDPNFQINRELTRRPRWSSTWGFEYHGQALFVGVGGQYVGKRDDVNFNSNTRVVQPSFVVWNGNISYTVLKNQEWLEQMKLFVRVLNIFDKNFEEVFGFTSPGISYIGGVEIKFG